MVDLKGYFNTYSNHLQKMFAYLTSGHHNLAIISFISIDQLSIYIMFENKLIMNICS